MSGYSYGIEGVSKNRSAQNFVINKGSDAAPVITGAGSISTASLSADSIRLAGIPLAGAATPQQLIDFSTARNLAAFGGRYVWFQVGDGLGSSVMGYCFVSAAGVPGDLHSTQGAVLAPVTAVTASIGPTTLNVAFTGKVAATTGTFQITACTV